MPYTAVQIRNAVLEDIGIKSRGGAARAEDAVKADEIYVSQHAALRNRGLADFDSDSVPDEMREPLIKFLVGKMAFKFGFSGQRLVDAKLEGKEGLLELQQQHAVLDPLPANVHYF